MHYQVKPYEEVKAVRCLKGKVFLDNVDLVGYQSNPINWLSQVDIFVLSSKEEELPRVLVEPMACGVTPVSMDYQGGGAAEILENGRYSYLVPINDLEAMSQAIVSALEKPFVSEILKKRASFFSVENSIQCYIIESDE